MILGGLLRGQAQPARTAVTSLPKRLKRGAAVATVPQKGGFMQRKSFVTGSQDHHFGSYYGKRRTGKNQTEKHRKH